MGSYTDETIKEVTYAGSLPVPNVQEIVRTNPSMVPERYINDMPHKTEMLHLPNEIPVIDLPMLIKGQEEELKKLDLACKDWGFFQVVNHGMAEELLRGMKNAVAGFFELPLQEKEKYSMDSNDIQGYGHAYVVSQEQKLDWSDTLILIIYPSKYRKLRFWPNAPKEFKEVVETYSLGVKKVAEELLRSLSLVLGLDRDALIQLHKEALQALRVNYYPTCCMPDQVLGISPHSDTSTITLLMQDDDTNGLQIRHDGEWVPVTPIPNALVVNVGDIIEILSNGKYKSIEHRAVTNEYRARISFATFVGPHDDVEIEPFDHMINTEQPLKVYKKVRYGDYLRQSMKMQLEGKAHTKMAKNAAN